MDALQVKADFLVVALVEDAHIGEVELMTGWIYMLKNFWGSFVVVDISLVFNHVVKDIS